MDIRQTLISYDLLAGGSIFRGKRTMMSDVVGVLGNGDLLYGI